MNTEESIILFASEELSKIDKSVEVISELSLNIESVLLTSEKSKLAKSIEVVLELSSKGSVSVASELSRR